MSAESKDFKVGDRVRLITDNEKGTIIHIVRNYAIVDTDNYDEPTVCQLTDLRRIPDQIAAKEQWLLIDNKGRVYGYSHEEFARREKSTKDTLARICHKRALTYIGGNADWVTLAIVCDENENPIEIEVHS